MSTVVDNLIAFKILYMLVTPFEKTKAYTLGIIDKDGTPLKKTKDLKTSEEKDAYTQLDKLVFSLKRLLAKVPGGSSQFASLVAAYYLIKENVYKSSVDEVEFNLVLSSIENGSRLIEEEIDVEEFLDLLEDVPANAIGSGAAVSTDYPAIRAGKNGRRYGVFDVDDSIFRRFAKGKKKFDKWSNYINTEDEDQSKIYHFARKNPRGIIVLKNGDKTKAIRFNRNGGGSWHKLKRQAKVQPIMHTEELV
jgi:hypothetical protein